MSESAVKPALVSYIIVFATESLTTIIAPPPPAPPLLPVPPVTAGAPLPVLTPSFTPPAPPTQCPFGLG